MDAPGIVAGPRSSAFKLYFRPVPQGIRAAIIGFAIYPNSVMPTVETGYVWFDDFRFENYSLR